MVNLFILILVQQFEEYHLNKNNPLNHWKSNLNTFQSNWTLFSDSELKIYLDDRKIINFFKKFPPPIGLIFI